MVEWRTLAEADLPAVLGIAAAVLAADGGLPLAATEDFLRRRFVDGATASTGAFEGEALAAVAAARPVGDLVAATGLVAPAWRGRGLGSRLVDWALERAQRLETESLTPAAVALFEARGLRQTFAEDVMAYDLATDPPETAGAPGLTLTPWTPEQAGRVFAVYEASFRERPGFPGWSQDEWVEWHTGDDDFAPEWTLLATRDGADVGFLAAARGAWIVQVGVVPAARGTGVGAVLVTTALRHMRAGGEIRTLLDVNVDNPGAADVYRRLGFITIGRRARFER